QLQQRELAWTKACDLAAQLRTYRAAGAGDHDNAAPDPVVQSGTVQHHRIAAEQVVKLDVAYLRNRHLAKVTVSQIRHVELDDLLGRDPVVLDSAGLNDWIRGRVIMVTGAGGSIGSELCRQIARFSPRQLALLEL